MFEFGVLAAKAWNLLTVHTQGGCALFSLQRFRQGSEAAFTDLQGGEGEYQQQEPPFQHAGEVTWHTM